MSTTETGAAEALRDIFEDIICVTPDDVDEVIEGLEARGFKIVKFVTSNREGMSMTDIPLGK